MLRDGATADAEELRRHCRLSLADYKVPRRFEFVEELPRSGSGKHSAARCDEMRADGAR